MKAVLGIVVSVLLVIAAAAGWIVLIRAFVRYWAGKAPLPLWSVWVAEALCLLIAGSFLYFPAGAILLMAVGPISLVLAAIPDFSGGFAYLIDLPQVAVKVLAVGIAAALWWTGGGLRRHAMVIAIPIAVAAGIGTGELMSRHAMTADATRIGAECLVRNSFLHSVLFSGNDNTPKPDIHAYAIAKGVEYLWSYSEASFVPVEDYLVPQSFAIERTCRAQLKG